jgi:hypothetical protein
MRNGTIQDLKEAARMIARCRSGDNRVQAELESITRRLDDLTRRLTAEAVRKVALP